MEVLELHAFSLSAINNLTNELKSLNIDFDKKHITTFVCRFNKVALRNGKYDALLSKYSK